MRLHGKGPTLFPLYRAVISFPKKKTPDVLLISEQSENRKIETEMIRQGQVCSLCSVKLFYSLMSFSAGIEVWNPAFDVTPHQLITGGIITELGVFLPSELQAALTGRLTAL